MVNGLLGRLTWVYVRNDRGWEDKNGRLEEQTMELESNDRGAGGGDELCA